MRYQEWVKNVFVFAAPLFARKLTEPGILASTLLAFAAFCCISSAVYIVNDAADIERDRLHPKKKFRALASGRVSLTYAYTVLCILVMLGLGLAWTAGGLRVVAVLALYGASNVLYSYVLKYLVILDVGFIAVGFILRIMAGALAADAPPSYWLILCTLNVSLFLGFAKRRAEVVTLGDEAGHHRAVLADYSVGFLDQMISIVTTSTLICYILYTVDERTIEHFGTRWLVATVPFVMYGIFRYLFLSYHRQEGGSPTRVVLTDPLFLGNNALWALSCVVLIYWGRDMEGWISQ